MASDEHEFLVSELHRSLERYSRTGLLGIAEAERRKFDYGCLLLRDMSRPLVAQALWANKNGIEKDLRTLFLDQESVLKVYLVQNNASYRGRIAEIVQAYKADPALRGKLGGFRLLTVPVFNTDSEEERRVVCNHLDRKLREDILFGIIFGQMTTHNFEVFAEHEGPAGLKYAILDEIGLEGLVHMPTYKRRLGYSVDGPIREALTMLVACGFVRRIPKSNLCIPTVKGRLILDLTRRLLFEWKKGATEWAPETSLILGALGVGSPAVSQPFELVSLEQALEHCHVRNILFHAEYCRREYGRDLLEHIDPTNPVFYSEFQWQRIFANLGDIPGLSEALFDDPAALFFARREGAGAKS